MTTSTTSPAAVTPSTTSPSTTSRETGATRPIVVRSRPSRRLVAVVLGTGVALLLGIAVAVSSSVHRDAAATVPAVAAAAPAVVGDASHGGPGSRADAVQSAIPPRQDDRAVLAHGGTGSVVTGSGTPRTQLP